MFDIHPLKLLIACDDWFCFIWLSCFQIWSWICWLTKQWPRRICHLAAWIWLKFVSTCALEWNALMVPNAKSILTRMMHGRASVSKVTPETDAKQVTVFLCIDWLTWLISVTKNLPWVFPVVKYIEHVYVLQGRAGYEMQKCICYYSLISTFSHVLLPQWVNFVDNPCACTRQIKVGVHRPERLYWYSSSSLLVLCWLCCLLWTYYNCILFLLLIKSITLEYEDYIIIHIWL